MEQLNIFKKAHTKQSDLKMGRRSLSVFKRFYLFIFRERGRDGEREGEKHQCVVTSRVPSTGDLAHNPGMCPDWELNQQPSGLQAGTQPREKNLLERGEKLPTGGNVCLILRRIHSGGEISNLPISLFLKLSGNFYFHNL